MDMNVLDGSLQSFREVAKTLPPLRSGKPVNVSTLHRWCKSGLRGVHLEYIQVGGTKCTTQEKLARFFSRLENPRSAPHQPLEKTSHRETLAHVERQLDELGI